MARDRTAERAATSIALRPMVIGDAELVLSWRNEPSIVARSSSQRVIPSDEHHSWMRHAVDDPDRLCLIILVNGAPAGHLRFDRAGHRALVTIYLVEGFTGAGAGVRALAEGTQLAFAQWPQLTTIDAFVWLENEAGRKAFRRAEFVCAGVTQSGHQKLTLMRVREGMQADQR